MKIYDKKKLGYGIMSLLCGYIDMIYEMYNESVAHFEGTLIQGSKWKIIEINVFFRELTIYYEEGD